MPAKRQLTKPKAKWAFLKHPLFVGIIVALIGFVGVLVKKNSSTSSVVKGNIANSNAVNIGGNNSGQVAGGNIINNTTVTQYQTTHVTEEWQPPELPVGCKWVTVSLGSATIQNPVSWPAWNPIIGIADNMLAQVRSNRLHLDADVTFDGRSSYTITNMSFRGNLPPNWDRNWNSYAYEIVGPDGLPVFQLFYKQPEHVVVNGFFPCANGAVVAAFEDGFAVGSPAMVQEKFKTRKPTFKYPAWKHRGELADR